MNIESEYSRLAGRAASRWQVQMAKQMADNHGFPIEAIERELNGSTFILRIDETLSSTELQNILSDIEDYIPANSVHVETREIQL